MSARVQHKPVVDMTPEEFLAALGDPMWRLSNLYKIMTKGEDGQEDLIVTFKPNRAQRRFIERLHYRNVILKARQLGFTTLACILFLDAALFTPNIRCGIIAQTDDVAKVLFRDKVKFAYDNLPQALREAKPLARDSADELLFANNSSIRVSTSMRGGTLHFLHVSEFGKICAEFPKRANEVITGSIPALTPTGILIIESTAEGREGYFYDIVNTAEANFIACKKLTIKDYRFHFFPWWQADEYAMDPRGVIITDEDHQYFDELESSCGCEITMRQRAWWCATRDADFAGQPEKMWQEYPSTSGEAFQKSLKGTYYAIQIAAARRDGRIATVPHVPGIPVNTFWDIGHSDGTAVWFHQRVGMRNLFIKFIEGWGEPYSHFVSEMQKTGWVWGRHYLPHDGTHVRQGQDVSLSPLQMLENLGLRHIEIVPRVSELQHGIQAVRDVFSSCWFDETHCKAGIVHLEMYRKQWNERLACFTDEPLKDIHTEGADSFRQFAQGYTQPAAPASKKGRARNWRTA